MDSQLLLMAKSGDNDAAIKVINSFEGLIVNQAKKFENFDGYVGVEFDDLRQVGYKAAVSAIKKIDENRLITAPAFIIQCIVNAIKSAASPSFKKCQNVSMDEEIGEDLTYGDIIVSDTHVEEEGILSIMMGKVKETVREMPLKDQELLDLHFNDPYGGMKEFADRNNADYRKVRYRKDLLIKELRGIFA